VDGSGLSLFSLAVVPPFVLDGGHIVKAGVQSEGVIEAFDVREDGHPGLGVGLKSAPVDELAFKVAKKLLSCSPSI